MEGTIAQVLETWPLQLLVEGSDGTWALSLMQTSLIRKGDRTLLPSQLRSGMRIRAFGSPTGERSLLVDSLDVLYGDVID
jgi:hypothetical protein